MDYQTIYEAIYFIEVIDSPPGLEEKLEDLEHPLYEELGFAVMEEVDNLIYTDSPTSMYINLPKDRVEEFCDVYRKYGCTVVCRDITMGVLNGTLPDKNISPNEDFFDSFRLKYTSLDHVLDKIYEHGMDSLDEIDKEILRRI